ncbi:GTPase domain-containing protein [Geomonas sp. Red69]|uniref:GTPase domain-containing protein n=1 Tax=Geomonas diazotrophica TaxID=2843197 RepID=A0ABX8JHA3_9BACT|nr:MULTISPECIES: GTPase domain-containing protein [Geomonas]MBU5635247.1 GTPase domain-containing protein [Geomonas diazotrophica]QWV97698.1 GTPase domain-containing protein [Geomonas nitrogeniifigens]QXE86834.1 GTPase domain-containing protein [Geomonas nitrogeniifigens]
MIEYSEKERRMVLKLVYYGPALSGKTTNLLQLHDLLTRQGRGELMVLDTSGDRTIYFDLLPFFLTAPSGLKIKVKVYTVPGQVCHDATRKAVLQRADGVAFIADSSPAEAQSNFTSFDNLERNLALVGLDIETLPLVIQFNKRDLPQAVSEREIRAAWDPTGVAVVMASALHGEGVAETFARLAGLVYDRIDARYALTGEHGLTRDQFVRQLTSLKEEP